MSSEPKTKQPSPTRAARPPKRATQIGVVTSTARQKTIRVTVAYNVRHGKYGKYLRRETTLHAHDEKNECHKGDVVEVMQCRPISKTKCWRLLRVVRRGTGGMVAPVVEPAAEVQP